MKLGTAERNEDFFFHWAELEKIITEKMGNDCVEFFKLCIEINVDKRSDINGLENSSFLKHKEFPLYEVLPIDSDNDFN